MSRGAVMRVFEEILQFGEVVATTVGAAKSVLFTVLGPQGEKPSTECDGWGDAALLSRPVAGAEVVYVQLGDERTVLFTRDRRWQIEVLEGEVVLRAMGPGTPGYIKLMPNGTVAIVSTATTYGALTATHGIPKGDALQTWLSAMTVPTAMGPSGTPINIGTFTASVVSTKHRIDA